MSQPGESSNLGSEDGANPGWSEDLSRKIKKGVLLEIPAPDQFRPLFLKQPRHLFRIVDLDFGLNLEHVLPGS